MQLRQPCVRYALRPHLSEVGQHSLTSSLTPRRAFDHLDSTNAEALRMAQMGERGPLWIDADRQSLGRGRAGRHWVSDPGNFMSSFLFTPSAPVAVLHQLSLVAGVAIIEAITQCAQQGRDQLSLKWPNDLMLGGAKAGGVLIESSAFAGETVAVIGIGLNVRTAPMLDGVQTAYLASALGDTINLDQLRDHLATTMDAWLKVWSDGAGFSKIRSAWRSHGPSIDTPLTINVGSETHAGQFAGLDEQGSLRLRAPSGEIQCYTFGDVSLPRNQAT